MGISRSASVVIAYVMKAKNWNLQKALTFVKNKRNCIKPNENFLKQLEVYQGILSARLVYCVIGQKLSSQALGMLIFNACPEK